MYKGRLSLSSYCVLLPPIAREMGSDVCEDENNQCQLILLTNLNCTLKHISLLQHGLLVQVLHIKHTLV